MTGTPTPDPFTDRQLQAIARLVDREVTRRLATRFAASERHRNIRLAKTVEADSQYPSSGNTFWIRFLDGAFNPLAAGSSTLTLVERTAEGDTDDAADVLAREINGLYVPKGILVFAMWQRGISGDPSSYGEWWIQAIAGTVGGCLAEDHPGRGTAFNIHLGTWDPAQDKWIYDTDTTVKAIDWRYGVPYPAAGATGLFEPRPSDTYGTIWEVSPLDCESPGECGS